MTYVQDLLGRHLRACDYEMSQARRQGSGRCDKRQLVTVGTAANGG
ncbi:hypothetical protein [Arthrobacter sp. FW306-04-A]